MADPLPSPSYQILQMVFEQVPFGLGCISLEGKWLSANSKLCEILRYSQHELQQRTYLDITFPDDLALTRFYFQRLQTGQISTISSEQRYVRKDGCTIWGKMTLALLSEHNKPSTCIVATLEEIQTHKQQAYDQEVRFTHTIQAQEQAENLTEQIQVMQTITDHALANLSLDDFFRSVLSRIRGIMDADNIAVLLLNKERTSLSIRAVDGIEETVAQNVRIPLGEGFAGTIAARCQPGIVGPHMPAEILTPILQEQLQALLGVPLVINGQVLGVIHIGTKHPRIFTQQDIELLERVADRLAWAIERSYLNAQTQQAQQEAATHFQQIEQMNQTIQHFVSIVGHEFRTALTGILGFSELLKSLDMEPGDVQDYATDIASDGQRLLRLIDDLLDLDRMQQGKMQLTLHFQLIDIAELLERQVKRARASTHAHMIFLILHTHLPMVQGDPEKLNQVMNNLLSNAIKYSPKGGEIYVHASQEGHMLHLSVQDQGVGIASTELKRIFEPYNRLHAHISHYIEGTGLGLSISKHLIELHKGHIWAESTAGQGSTFHITLPTAQHDDAHLPKTDAHAQETKGEGPEQKNSISGSKSITQMFSSLQQCVLAFSDLIHCKNEHHFQIQHYKREYLIRKYSYKK